MRPISKMILIVSLAVNALLMAGIAVMEDAVQLSDRVLATLGIELPLRSESLKTYFDYLPLATHGITVHGVAGYKQGNADLGRLAYIDNNYRTELKKLGRHTSGVRVRFKTDSYALHLPFLKIKPVSFSYHDLSEQGSSGVDLYIDGNYVRTLVLNELQHAIAVAGPDMSKEMRLIELYLPSFSPAELRVIGIVPGSRIAPAEDFAKTIAFYGTSITQGASSPRPGLTYPAIISRSLGADFYNLGFAGNGRGDPEIAKLLAEIEADVYVLEYSRQASVVQGSIANNLIDFCRILKSRRPQAAIVVITAIYDTSEDLRGDVLESGRSEFRLAFEQLKTMYDWMHLVEGRDLLGPDDREHYVDGTHPNAYGMWIIAERLRPVINAALAESSAQ